MSDAINEAVLARQPIYPAAQSMSGTNTYTVGCKEAGFRAGYAVCLNKIAAFERDRSLSAYTVCETAIKGKSCPAMPMREQEQLAGKAMYYVDRRLMLEELDKQAQAQREAYAAQRPPVKKPAHGTTSPTAASTPQPKIAAKSIQSTSNEEDGYAAAINAAIKETQAQAATPEPVETPEPVVQKPGMSLLEIAKLHMKNSHPKE